MFGTDRIAPLMLAWTQGNHIRECEFESHPGNNDKRMLFLHYDAMS